MARIAALPSSMLHAALPGAVAVKRGGAGGTRVSEGAGAVHGRGAASTAVTTDLDDSRLRRWEHRVEWPLALVALTFLAAYSVRVLAETQGAADAVVSTLLWVTYAAFAVDYIV